MLDTGPDPALLRGIVALIAADESRTENGIEQHVLPEPSEIRPQRGSRATSTIGLNVRSMPQADASDAAIRADASASSGFHDAAMPSGMGKRVR